MRTTLGIELLCPQLIPLLHSSFADVYDQLNRGGGMGGTQFGGPDGAAKFAEAARNTGREL